MPSSTSRMSCTPTSLTSCSRFILSSISLMMETSKSVFPSQQNTYSKGLRSSLAIRLVMPWLKGVSITIGICSYRFLMYRATSKLSLSPVPGMQMMRSKEMEDSCVSASSQVETCVKRGG